MSVRLDSKLAKGGLVLTVPALGADSGSAAELLNFETDISGGFRRVAGFERFDGRIPPSSGWSEPWEWDLAGAGSSPDGDEWDAVAPVEGNLNESVTLCIPLNGLSLLDGVTMPAGGELAILVHDGNQAHYTAQTYATQGAFLAAIMSMPGIASAEVVNDSLCITSTIPGTAVYPRLEVLQWVVLDDSKTKEVLRSAIQKPQGFGPIYGVAVFKGCVICARNFDEDGTDSRIYRSTPNGWEQIPTSARVGNAEYNFVEYNFYGDPQRAGLYGADGKNKAFEIKGDPYPGVMQYTEIDTVVTVGPDTYYPTMVSAHAMHLFLAFRGGWVQYSGIGDPFSDDVNDGSGGMAYSGEITDMVSLKDDAFAITTREEIHILYGKSDADWQSNSASVQGDGVGAIPKTATSASGQTFIADRGGIFSIDAVLAYGNFSTAALSRPINTLYQALHPYTVGAVATRALGLYRVYYSEGEFISMTFGPSGILGFGYGKLSFAPQVLAYGVVEPTPLDYIPISADEGAMATEPLATFPLGHGSEADPDAEVSEANLALYEESVFIGSADGMVYRMDKGESFDGADIPAAIRFHFHNGGSPRQVKRWRKAVFEIKAPELFQMHSNAVMDYGGTEEAALHRVDIANLTQSGGVWDFAQWQESFWSGKDVGEGEMRIDGHARNVALMLYCEGQIPSFLIEGYTVHFSPRRLAR